MNPTPGKAPASESKRASYNGREITFAPGQSVAAALAANGVQAWRGTRREGRPRGLFCGIGICFDCLLTVDGLPNQRACLVEAAEGMCLEGLDEGRQEQ